MQNTSFFVKTSTNAFWAIKRGSAGNNVDQKGDLFLERCGIGNKRDPKATAIKRYPKILNRKLEGDKLARFKTTDRPNTTNRNCIDHSCRRRNSFKKIVKYYTDVFRNWKMRIPPLIICLDSPPVLVNFQWMSHFV